MPKENSRSNAQIAQRVEQVRQLLDEILALVRNSGRQATPSKKAPASRSKMNYRALDFSMPIRAFVKQYGVNMNGSQIYFVVGVCDQGRCSEASQIGRNRKALEQDDGKGPVGDEIQSVVHVPGARE
jgi:hypothetical protein